MTRVAVFTAIFLGVWGVFTAVFAASAPKAQVRLMPKWIWVLLCVFVPFFGGLLYLMVGRPLGDGKPGGAGGRRPTKVVAPDDDPRFLRDLEKRLREQAERDKGAKVEDEPGKAEGEPGKAAGEGENPNGGEPNDGDETPKPKDS